MSGSLIADVLAERPTEELEALRDRALAKQSKLTAEAARLKIELGQIEDALSRGARKRGPKKAKRRSASAGGPTARERVRDAVQSSEGPLTPADISDLLRPQGFLGSPSSIHNALKRLVKDGEIAKAGDGLYENAPPSGSEAEAETGASENGTHESLLTTAWSQEGG